MNLKKTALAVTIAGVLSMGVAGTASAQALAVSVIQLNNLLFKDADTGIVLDVTDFVGLTYTSTADASASLNGITESASDSAVAGDAIDLPITGMPFPGPNDLCVGACPAIGANAFPIFSSASGDPTTTFAAADQYQAGSPVSGLLDSNGDVVAVGATVEAASYVSLMGQGGGSSTANNGLSGTVVFTASRNLGVEITFDAIAYLEAYTDGTSAFPTFAQASYNVDFKVVNLSTGNTEVFNWAPNGANFIDVGTESSDPVDLNDSVSRNAPFNGASCSGNTCAVAQTGSFSATTLGLVAGNSYQITFGTKSQADAQVVPEPSVLALMGLGLLGMAGVARRRKSA